MTEGPNSFAIKRERRGARFDDFAGENIGVDVNSAQLGEPLPDHRLARRDAAREPDQVHPAMLAGWG